MKYIVSTLELMDTLAYELEIEPDINDKYSDIIQGLSKLSESVFIFSTINSRSEVETFLDSLEIENQREIIAKLLKPYTLIAEADKEYLESMTLNMLSDTLLLKFFVMVMRTISISQRSNLAVLKYSVNIHNTGWHKLAKQCRGKVIDIGEKCIVSYPFNKFYNLGEVEETKEKRIIELLSDAKYISVTDKKDGSTIILSKYQNEIVINTNGGFDSIQVTLAKQLLETKYKQFYDAVPDGYTFIFELIHPNNRIVLDYGKEKSMYLLAVRDLKSFKLMTYKEIQNIASEYGLDVTESIEYTRIEDFTEKTQSDTEELKEGWVFRVITDTEDMLFKLKYDEYFKLHKIRSRPSLKNVYTLLVSGNLDDVLSGSNNPIKEESERIIAVIYDYIDKFKAITMNEADEILVKYNVKVGEIPKEELLKILDELKPNCFKRYILDVIKGTRTESGLLCSLPPFKSFDMMYQRTNELLEITPENYNVNVM